MLERFSRKSPPSPPAIPSALASARVTASPSTAPRRLTFTLETGVFAVAVATIEPSLRS
jgi:hypothetical protein